MPLERFGEFGVRKDRSQRCELVAPTLEVGSVFVDSTHPSPGDPFANCTIRTDAIVGREARGSNLDGRGRRRALLGSGERLGDFACAS